MNVQLFLVNYALSGVIGALGYTFVDAMPKGKLEFFYLMSATINFIALIVVSIWLKIPRDSNETKPLLSASKIQNEDTIEAAAAATTAANQPKSLREIGWKLFFGSKLLWLNLVCLLLAFGGAVNFYNNTGSIILSLDGSSNAVIYSFLIFCGGQLLGRMLSSTFIHREGSALRCAAIFVISPLIQLTISLVCSFVNSVVQMFVFSALNAMVYGSLWVLIFDLPNTGKTFETERQSIAGLAWTHIYGVLCFAPAIGPLVFDFISGTFYDRHAVDNYCVGLVCYSNYFIICSAAQFVALLVGIATFVYSWRLARK